MAFTVTATPGGPSAQRGVDLLVRVLTNATEAGGASSGGANAAAGTAGGSLTPNFSGSFIAFATTSDGATTTAAAAANNTYDSSAGGHLDTWISGFGHYTGTVTASTPLTYGAGGTAPSADHENWCAYEVPAQGGTITVDGSSPAYVFSDIGTTATTASFNPPAGSVLVVMVSVGCSGSGAGATCAISDTSGLGMTWTQRKTSSTSDNFQPTFIFTATVPAAAPPPAVASAGQWANPWPAPMASRFGPVQPFAPPPAGAALPPPPPPQPPGVPPPAPQPLPPAAPGPGLPGMPGGTAFGTWPVDDQRATAPPPRYITGLAGGTAGYFVDQFGAPILYLQDVPWGLPANAGRWNGGDWRTDMGTYLSARAAQGFTCIRVHTFGTTKTGAPADTGNTHDGINPFSTSNDPTSGLNPAYWQRIDYLVDEAAARGITVELTAAFRWDFDSTIFASTWTTTQCTNFGTALGARYKNRPNVLWFFGDDYNGQYDTQFNAIIAAMRAAGDTHKATIEYFATGSTSRRDLSGNPSDTAFAWGGASADYNLAYYYEPTYFAVEFAYAETSPIPVIWGDGFYFGDAASAPTDNRLDRNFAWWALSSGARGVSTGSDAVWQWPSTAMAAVLSEGWFTSVAAKVRALVESLPGWYNLIPDTSSVLVTAGRGTRAAYSNQFYLASTDTYVSASRTPDGSLAVIYMSVSSSITIDQTKLGAGYTATWADPASGALTPTSTGSTYSSSGLGSNSAGGTDWVLILAGPAVAGSVSANAGVASATAAAAGPAVSAAAQPPAAAGLAAGTAAGPSAAAQPSAAAGLAASASSRTAGTSAPGAASALAAAPGPAPAATAGPPAAGGLAAAPGPVPAVTAAAPPAAGLAVGNPATVSTSSAATASPTAAAGTATAAPAVIAVTASAGVASATAAAGLAIPAAAARPGPAAATAPAAGPVPAAAAQPPAAVSSAAAPGPVAGVAAQPPAAPGLAAANPATAGISGNTQAHAGVAAATAIAAGPAASVTAAAPAAAALAAAPPAAGQTGRAPAAAPASSAAVALPAVIAVTARAGVASATAIAPAAGGHPVSPVVYGTGAIGSTKPGSSSPSGRVGGGPVNPAIPEGKG